MKEKAQIIAAFFLWVILAVVNGEPITPQYAFDNWQQSPIQWQQSLRSELIKMLALPKCKDRSVFNEKIEIVYEDLVHKRYYIEFDALEGERIVGYLLTPKNMEPPYPVMICLQGHLKRGIEGSIDPEAAGGRSIAIDAVRNGWAALAIEQKGFGRRKGETDCNHVALSAILRGENLTGKRVFDVIRTIDFVFSREELDNYKIACMGNSTGGTVSFYSAAVDKRIKLAVVSCSFCTFEKSWLKYPHCSCGYIPGLLKYADMPDIAGLIAPRSLLVVAGNQDNIADIDGVTEAVDYASNIYGKFDAADKIDLIEGDGGHQFYPELAWPVINRIKKQWNVTVANKKLDGFHGIWYRNQTLGNEYKYKYSGGLGTYCAKHKPMAIYSERVDKTFFVYGGSQGDYHLKDSFNAKNLDTVKVIEGIGHCIAEYDHKLKTVSRPTLILDKQTLDAHDNPVISVDDEGFLWVFSTSHGNMRPSYVFKSCKPYDISEFKQIHCFERVGNKLNTIDNFSYMQAWNIKEKGFLYFFTKYRGWGSRNLYFSKSSDGVVWDKFKEIAQMGQGSYQITAVQGDKAAVAFNYHPENMGVNGRSNLYYVETCDYGENWSGADGIGIELPVRDIHGKALIYNSQKHGLLVYLKDICIDNNGNPVILFITSDTYKSGVSKQPRYWNIARFDGGKWLINRITTASNNYDMGSLYVDNDTILIAAPTIKGTQPYNPGGEVAYWISNDNGNSWKMDKQLTCGSRYNHTYVRKPLNAAYDFYAFWADGDCLNPSESSIYFSNRDGDVFKLPQYMNSQNVKPLLLSEQDGYKQD
ncbi:MAG: BNR-4 repeat-containing protein [Sedimentisphaeraceae bacterium JB056]